MANFQTVLTGIDGASCVQKCFLEIGYDDGITPLAIDTSAGNEGKVLNVADWLEIPGCVQIDKTFDEEEADEIRHSNSSGKFVKECDADSRTENYAITFGYRNTEPVEWFARNGEQHAFRMRKDRSTPAAGNAIANFADELLGKFVDNGFSWNNNDRNTEQKTINVEAVGAVYSYLHDQNPSGSTQPYKYIGDATPAPAWP